MVLSRLEKNELFTIYWWHLAGAGSSFLRGVVMAVVLIPLGTAVCGLTKSLPVLIIDGMVHASSIIWGTVAAPAVLLYLIKGKKYSLFFGAIGGFLWILMNFNQKV